MKKKIINGLLFAVALVAATSSFVSCKDYNGDNYAELQEKYAGKVQCVGFVDNLAQILSGTTLIVPLNIGSGIRMKVLEAAQLNVPVVTTSVGVEGLPLQNGVHCFIADDANQFVEDILRLQDRQLRLKFVENTRQTITNKYSLQALQESRRLLYN